MMHADTQFHLGSVFRLANWPEFYTSVVVGQEGFVLSVNEMVAVGWATVRRIIIRQGALGILEDYFVVPSAAVDSG